MISLTVPRPPLGEELYQQAARAMYKARDAFYARLYYRDNFMYNVEANRKVICEAAPILIQGSFWGFGVGVALLAGGFIIHRSNEEGSVGRTVSAVLSGIAGVALCVHSYGRMAEIVTVLSNYRYPL